MQSSYTDPRGSRRRFCKSGHRLASLCCHFFTAERRGSSKGRTARLSAQLFHPTIEPLEDRALLDGTSFLVDSLSDVIADDGVVTLREAIEAANTNAAVADAPAGSQWATDLIQFDPSLTVRN